MGVGTYVLDEAGKPVPEPDLWRWERWMMLHADERILGDDTIRGVRVSTVFLGLDHRGLGRGKPILWETKIFGSAELGEACWRYTSQGAAEIGHRQIVRVLTEGGELPD